MLMIIDIFQILIYYLWRFDEKFIEELKNDIPELPDDKKKRFIEEFKLSPYEANILVSDIDTAKYFEEVVAKMGKNKDMKVSS